MSYNTRHNKRNKNRRNKRKTRRAKRGGGPITSSANNKKKLAQILQNQLNKPKPQKSTFKLSARSNNQLAKSNIAAKIPKGIFPTNNNNPPQSPSSNTSSAATKSVKSNANSIDCNKCKKICK